MRAEADRPQADDFPFVPGPCVSECAGAPSSPAPLYGVHGRGGALLGAGTPGASTQQAAVLADPSGQTAQ